MDNEQQRRLLLSQFHDLVSILHERGLANDVPSEEEIKIMSSSDLAQWVRSLRDISRTPE